MRFILKPLYFLAFLWLYISKVVQGSVQVGLLALAPRILLKPAFISIPLSGRSDLEILLLSNLISMTPGTLSVDIDEKRTQITVHCLNVDDQDAVIHEIKELFEKRVMDLVVW